jgi:hypothetical protein
MRVAAALGGDHTKRVQLKDAVLAEVRMFEVGSKYISRPTARNAKNSIVPDKEVRIAHVSQNAISIRVFQNGSELRLLVPRELFGVNFEEDRSFLPPNTSYASAVPFITIYL